MKEYYGLKIIPKFEPNPSNSLKVISNFKGKKKEKPKKKKQRKKKQRKKKQKKKNPCVKQYVAKKFFAT